MTYKVPEDTHSVLLAGVIAFTLMFGAFSMAYCSMARATDLLGNEVDLRGENIQVPVPHVRPPIVSHLPALPDIAITPGAINPDIAPSNLKTTICDHEPGTMAHDKNEGHWSTKSIRPPQSYTSYLKRKLIDRYGYKNKSMKAYELDHLIPLSSGGHPYDPRNLWPQPWVGKCNAKQKDQLEWTMNTLICNGTVTLRDAQQMFAGDWVGGYVAYVDPKGCGLEEGDTQE